MTDKEKRKILKKEGWFKRGDFWIAPNDEDMMHGMLLDKAWKYNRSVERSGGSFGICDVHQKVEIVYGCGGCGGVYCEDYLDSDDHGCDDIRRDRERTNF